MASDDLDYEFLTPLDGDKPALLFRRMVAREALGRLPEYRLELLRETKDTAIKAQDLLGAKVDIKIRLGASSNRYINGYVTRFEQGGVIGRYSVYRVTVRPWLWQTTLGADCKVFQNKTPLAVIEAVFADYAQAGSVDKSGVSGATETRPYTVQYRESDFNFVLRLMEQEGIHFYFKHAKGSHTLVLTDEASTHPAIPDGTLKWGPEVLGDQLAEEVVTEWTLAQQLGSLKYATTDYAAEQPTLDMSAKATRTVPYSNGPSGLEVFDYPGGYDDLSMDGQPSERVTLGGHWAQHEVDRYESGRRIASGLTPYRSTAAGLTFTFASHADAGDYLLTAVDTEINFAHYEARDSELEDSFSCRFEAVPKATPFRPEAIARRPMVYGPQTATVTGASGDEIMTDKYGRVKVQFRWDRIGARDDKSSCWIRCSQPWAGKQFGMISLPRVGDEVVVEFLEGNPDRPLITGRVYNGDNMPPYALPDQATVTGIKTRSSKGGAATNFNELRFDDKKDSEYVWLQAEKDFHRLVKNDDYDTVSNDQWTEVTKNAQHKVGENYTLSVGKVSTISLTGDTHVKVGADLNSAVTGALNVAVTDKTAIKGTGAVALTSEQGIDVKAGMALNVAAGTTLHLKAGTGVVIDGGMQLCIKAGPAFIVLGPDGVTIQGPMVKINSGGSAGQANDAAAASPATPKDPGDAKQNKDPLASS